MEIGKRIGGKMYTKKDIIRDIEHLGILSSDTVMVHTSLKSIGATENNVDTVLDALCEYISSGLVVIPGHTWSYINAQNLEFDVMNSPVCVGVMPEIFRKRKGVYRSLHPTHSLLAYGQDAKEFVSGEEKFDTPCAPDSCYGKLKNRDGKVLLIGVNFMSCTLIHCIEEVANVPDRLTDTREQLQVKDINGEVISIPSHRHHNANSDHYQKLEPVLEYRHVLTKGKIGNADAIVCKIQDLFRITLELIEKDIKLFDDNEPVPKEWF